MKTIELADEDFDVLDAIVRRQGADSISTYLARIPELCLEKRRRKEKRLLQTLSEKNFRDLSLQSKFLEAVRLIQTIAPDRFKRLEGFTKPNGQVVFISGSKEKILKTSASAHPEAIGDSGMFLNVHGGQRRDFENLIDLICRELELSAAVPAELKQKVIRPERPRLSMDDLLAL